MNGKNTGALIGDGKLGDALAEVLMYRDVLTFQSKKRWRLLGTEMNVMGFFAKEPKYFQVYKRQIIFVRYDLCKKRTVDIELTDLYGETKGVYRVVTSLFAPIAKVCLQRI